MCVYVRESVRASMCVCAHECVAHRELVVDLVDVFVDPTVVEEAVEEVMPSVLNHCTTKTLSHHVRPGHTHTHIGEYMSTG